MIGTLRTEDIKTITGLLHIWEKDGRPIDRVTPFSRTGLARVLRKKTDNRSLDSLADSLRRIRLVPWVFEGSFYDKETGQWLSFEQGITILKHLLLVERKDKNSKKPLVEKGAFGFDDNLARNMLRSHSKPILLDVVTSIRGEHELIFYKYLDNVLFGKTHFERRSKELFADLGIQGNYPYRSDRKKEIAKWVKNLKGKRLSHGKIAHIVYEETADKQDYKIVVSRFPYFASYKYSMEDPNLCRLVESIIELTGDPTHRYLYEHYAKRHGSSILDHAHGQLKEEINRRRMSPDVPPIRNYPAYFCGIVSRLSSEVVSQ